MTYCMQSTDIFWLKTPKNTEVRVEIIMILALVIMSTKSHAARKNMLYLLNKDYNDTYIANMELTIFEPKSMLACSMLCNHNEQCQSISYNSLSMRCQHFREAFWNRQNINGTMESGWLHYDPYEALDCKDWNDKHCVTGMYPIFPRNVRNFRVKCEMAVDGGGWTIIQQRFDGTVNFQRTWAEYKAGFGDLKGEIWLGNDRIHAMTSSADYELRIDISDWHGNSWYALYKTFMVGDEISQYKLTIGNYSGNAGDDMAFHNGMKFSTMDRDNDPDTTHCSRDWGGNGGWWYAACDSANLNSIYGEDIGEKIGIEWTSALSTNNLYTLRYTRMMIRRL